jgi:fucose 4-O-acetylase-like acetyltransferase
MADSGHSRPRLIEIDQSKGLAIFLVVVGHVHPSDVWLGRPEFHWLAETIYHFHMAFFMFLSGVVTWYTYRPLNTWKEYTGYVWRRFSRFFPAYVCFALLISISKALLAMHFQVDRPPENLWRDWLNFLVSPLDSSATNLWYIYVLIAYAVVMPPLARLAKGKLQWLLPVAAVVYFLPVPKWFLLSMIARHAVVFLLGGVVAANYPAFAQWIDRFWVLAVALFVGLCASWCFVPVPASLMKFVTGLVSIAALFGCIRRFGLQSRWLSLMGQYTFVIYLVNMLAMGLIQILAIKCHVWSVPAGILWLPVSVAAGIILPILAKRYLFVKIPWLDRITT